MEETKVQLINVQYTNRCVNGPKPGVPGIITIQCWACVPQSKTGLPIICEAIKYKSLWNWQTTCHTAPAKGQCRLMCTCDMEKWGLSSLTNTLPEIVSTDWGEAGWFVGTSHWTLCNKQLQAKLKVLMKTTVLQYAGKLCCWWWHTGKYCGNGKTWITAMLVLWADVSLYLILNCKGTSVQSNHCQVPNKRLDNGWPVNLRRTHWQRWETAHTCT